MLVQEPSGTAKVITAYSSASSVILYVVPKGKTFRGTANCSANTTLSINNVTLRISVDGENPIVAGSGDVIRSGANSGINGIEE